MARKTDASCSECYFRHEGLCALAGETPCPTFRLATRGRLEPPKQAQLVPLTRDNAEIGRDTVPPVTREQRRPAYA